MALPRRIVGALMGLILLSMCTLFLCLNLDTAEGLTSSHPSAISTALTVIASAKGSLSAGGVGSGTPVNAEDDANATASTASSTVGNYFASTTNSTVGSDSSPPGSTSSNETTVEPVAQKLAYMLYATNAITACNALIMAKNIRRLGTPASIDIVVLVGASLPEHKRAALVAGGLIVVVPWLQRNAPHDTWIESLTKLRIFEERGYERVIYLDSDAWLHRNLDHLFHLGEAVFWAPRAYYQDQPFIGSTLLVLAPSNRLFRQLEQAVLDHPREEWYDMDVLNVVWRDMYGMLPNHYVFLNSEINSDRTFGFETPEERINHTYVHHFSMMDNGKYGKPWRMNRFNVERKPEWHPLFYKLFDLYWASQDEFCGGIM
uniref:Secreted protein n=1 Tax=Achlya hypogyna TaxID=1202772 RepID=A0A0A7CMV9_ACHHY|nr:secreted protein [Achlya hypogyna]